MSSQKTWSYVALGSAILSAAGGALAGIAGAVGTDAAGQLTSTGKTLVDIGGIAAQVGKFGVNVATAGAFAQAPASQQQAALVNAGPIVAAITSTGTASDAQRQQQASDASRQRAAAQTAAAVTSQRGPLELVADLIALPFKLLAGLFGGGGSKTA